MSRPILRSSRQSLLIAAGLALCTISAGTAASRLGSASPTRELPSAWELAPLPKPVVTLGEPELTAEALPVVTLASAVKASLANTPQRPVAASAAPQLPAPPSPSVPKRWACGQWQELWQGRGDARSCEWR
jgi:hypothetical protein